MTSSWQQKKKASQLGPPSCQSTIIFKKLCQPRRSAQKIKNKDSITPIFLGKKSLLQIHFSRFLPLGPPFQGVECVFSTRAGSLSLQCNPNELIEISRRNSLCRVLSQAGFFNKLSLPNFVGKSVCWTPQLLSPSQAMNVSTGLTRFHWTHSLTRITHSL